MSMDINRFKIFLENIILNILYYHKYLLIPN